MTTKTDTDTTIVIMGTSTSGYGGVWAQGADLAAAKKEFTRHGGGLSRGYSVITYGPGSTFEGVADSGRYFWKGDEPTVEDVKPRGKKR